MPGSQGYQLPLIELFSFETLSNEILKFYEEIGRIYSIVAFLHGL